MRLVLDTNVLVAAMRSPKGAPARVLESAIDGRLALIANPALFLEYEAVLKRPEHLAAAGLSLDAADVFVRGLARLIVPAPGPLWRPLLTDPDDEMVLEAAINGAADAIATFETTTFSAVASRFGIAVLTPGEIWRRIKP